MEIMIMAIAFWVHGYLFNDAITESHKAQPQPTAQVDIQTAQAALKGLAKNACEKGDHEACDFVNQIH